MGTAGNPVHEYRGERRLAAGLEEFAVDLAGGCGVVLELVQENMHHHRMPEIQSRLFERGLHILHALAHLLLEGSRMSAAGKLVALAGNIEHVARFHPRGERESRRAESPKDFTPRGIGIGDTGDFDAGISGNIRHSHRGARRGIVREKLAVDLVELGIVVRVFQVAEGMHHIIQVQPGHLEGFAHLVQAVARPCRRISSSGL